MRILRNPWWWLTVALFLGHQLVIAVTDTDLGAIDDYLDPFCAAPILLGLWCSERRMIFGAPRISGLETAVATALLAVIFEEVFPRYEEGFRRDWVDYLFYALGGLYFYFLIDPRGESPALTDRADGKKTASQDN